MSEQSKYFSSFDVFAFTICSTIGIGMVFLPFVGGEEIRSAWLFMLFVSLPFFLLLYLMSQFAKRYENPNLILQLKENIYPVLFWPIVIYFMISTIFGGIVILRGLLVMTQVFLLPNSPQWVILGYFLSIAAIGVLYGIKTITRFVVVFVAIEFFVFFVLIFFGFRENFRIIYVLPVQPNELIVLVKSSISDLARFAGLVTLLSFIPYVKNKDKLLFPMNLGLGFVVLFYVVLSLIVIGTFGFEEALNLLSPLIAVVQTFSTGQGVFERFDLFFLSFWLAAFLKLTMILIWFSSFIIKESIPNISKPFTIFIVVFLMGLGALLIPNYDYQVWGMHHRNAAFYSLILPIFLLSYLLIKKRKDS
ncbi:GerAB/ArcD/ProY family transporter [Halalkalibacter urbisdiaboli]|uniref:GerAB/ArcD/ProY family transporter n=1 Tax=Halalkalibacter urbisdiaboli TaxID=1960589 RepID=UPI000B432D12|nr:GerAB/ArcD/ProY family transporter [Halalkalibacter urbisdiaboli]